MEFTTNLNYKKEVWKELLRENDFVELINDDRYSDAVSWGIDYLANNRHTVNASAFVSDFITLVQDNITIKDIISCAQFARKLSCFKSLTIDEYRNLCKYNLSYETEIIDLSTTVELNDSVLGTIKLPNCKKLILNKSSFFQKIYCEKVEQIESHTCTTGNNIFVGTNLSKITGTEFHAKLVPPSPIEVEVDSSLLLNIFEDNKESIVNAEEI